MQTDEHRQTDTQTPRKLAALSQCAHAVHLINLAGMRQRAEQSARASQVERASEYQASHLVSQPASLLKSGPAANLPVSLPVSISQLASQAKRAEAA